MVRTFVIRYSSSLLDSMMFHGHCNPVGPKIVRMMINAFPFEDSHGPGWLKHSCVLLAST